MNELELFFSDLNEQAKKKVMEFYGMESAGDGNWEILPLCILCNEDTEYVKRETQES